MSDWRDTTLGDVLTLQRGFDITKREQRLGQVPVVSSSGVGSFHNEARVAPPGVVIGRKGSLGTAFFINEPFWPHDTTLWVKDFKGNDPYFCYLLLKSQRLAALDVGSSNPTLNRNHLHARDLRVPGLRTQRRIAALISAFDELIAINKRRIELLEGLMRSIYRAWFVRLEPPGVTPKDATESKTGHLPFGWRLARLGDVATLSYGKPLPAKSRRPGSVEVVSSAGVIDEHDESLVHGPGIVVGRKGNVGSVWWLESPFFPIDTTYYVESALPLGLLYWQLRHMEFIDSHAAVPGLSRDQAYGLPIVIPPEQLAHRFDESHRACFATMASLRKENAALVRARDLLLPRLVTGRLDISEIDLGNLLPSDPA